jgi:hypothetical protein
MQLKIANCKLQSLVLIIINIETLYRKNKKKWIFFTAGLALLLVRGKRRVPAPPPKMIEATLFGSALGVSK